MELDTSYRQKRCRHGWVDGKQCEACETEKALAECRAEVKRLKAEMLTAASILEKDGDEHGVGYALRRAMTPNVK